MIATLLGTAAHTDPLPLRRRNCLAIEADGMLFWVDAAEDVARAARQAGIDLLATRAILCTRMTMAAIAGLPGLLWTIRQCSLSAEVSRLDGGSIEILLPSVSAWNGIVEMLETATGNRYAQDFLLRVTQYHDGVSFQENGVAIRACHNRFLGAPRRPTDWPSYGLRFECGGKSLVVSGSFHRADDLLPLVGPGCNCLILDSAHAPLAESCRCLRASGAKIGQFVLTGLVEETAADPRHVRETVQDLLGLEPLLPEDGARLEL